MLDGGKRSCTQGAGTIAASHAERTPADWMHCSDGGSKKLHAAGSSRHSASLLRVSGYESGLQGAQQMDVPSLEAQTTTCAAVHSFAQAPPTLPEVCPQHWHRSHLTNFLYSFCLIVCTRAKLQTYAYIESDTELDLHHCKEPDDNAPFARNVTQACLSAEGACIHCTTDQIAGLPACSKTALDLSSAISAVDACLTMSLAVNMYLHWVTYTLEHTADVK
jgi:hypothetical protein